jgi:hypothetical protein
MVSSKLRIVSVCIVLVGTLALGGLLAPGATAIEVNVAIVAGHQPRDASVNDLITAGPFDPTGASGFVKVKVTSAAGPVAGAEISFVLATGPGLASGALSVASEITNVQGIAIFDESLSIADANEPFLTSYRLVPVATVSNPEGPPSSFSGQASDPFDIWDAGCHGTGCAVGLRGDLDTYRTTEDVGLGASIVPFSSLGISCAGQRVVFANDVFFHATTGSGPVSLVNHITSADLRLAPPTGRIGWCVGLKSPDAWVRNGAPYTVQDVNGTAPGGVLYVAMAPKCLKPNPSSYAPCVLTQVSDNAGGGIITGWLPGGDPPRRT